MGIRILSLVLALGIISLFSMSQDAYAGVPFTVSIGDASKLEGDGTTTFSFPITVSNISSDTVSVSVSTAENTVGNIATENVDYQGITGTATVSGDGLGGGSGIFIVAVIGDPDIEPDETFLVNVLNCGGGAYICSDPQGVGTIIDDDTPADVVFTTPGDITIEGDTIGGRASVPFTVSAVDNSRTPSAVLSPVCNPVSGSPFSLGLTTVNCSALSFNQKETPTETFDVTVVDTTPPSNLLVGLGRSTDLFMTPEATLFNGISYNSFVANTGFPTDIVDPNPIITNTGPSLYPIGTTPVQTTVTDASGNSFTSIIVVTVIPADVDGDGIVDVLDTDAAFSELIEDLPEGTTGEITDRGGQAALIIFEEPDPEGIRFVNEPFRGEPAILQVCDNAAEITIDGDDSGIVTCGSVEVGIVTGSVETSFTTGGPPVTSTMTAPEKLLFEPGTLTITNTGAVPATITFLGETTVLAPGESIKIVIPSSGKGSITSQDPNLGDVRYGRGHDNGFCMNQNCINVDGYFNHFPETTVRQGSTQSFTVVVNCPRGANTCNHITLAGVLPDSDFYDDQWSVTVDREPRSENWDMSTNNPYNEIGEPIVTVQTVSHSFVTATFNIPFLIPGSVGTHDGIGDPQENNRHLHVTVWDSNGGMSNYIFNDGVYVNDIYAYPQVETSYDAPIEIESLCHNEDEKDRNTCAFEKVRQWTLKNAEAKLKEIYEENNYKTGSELD